MKCPKCDGTLQRVQIDQVDVDQCDRCSGLWFDLGELQKVLAAEDVQKIRSTIDRSGTQDAQRAICPVCGGAGKMVPVVSRNREVHVDTCSICYGQWLDGGELEQLRKKGLFQGVAGFFRSLGQ